MIRNAFADSLPALRRHRVGEAFDAEGVDAAGRARYEAFERERAGAGWFAALVETSPAEAWMVRGRFRTWGGLMDYLQEQDAVVEVWTLGEGGMPARRVTAGEMGRWRAEGDRRPTMVAVVYRDPTDRRVVTNRLEVGFEAAALSLESLLRHARHRQYQGLATRLLAARSSDGRGSARAQWLASEEARREGEFPLEIQPSWPEDDRDLFVAVEYATDGQGHFERPVRLWRGSEVEPRVKAGVPRLVLSEGGSGPSREVFGFARRGISDTWERIDHPIPGRDMLELRIRDAAEADPRRWPVLEFGEPEMVRQVSLSRFALLAAHLERQRKAVAVRRANLALIAEPIIAGINIAGGVMGWGFPVGEAVRLAYDLLLNPLLVRVPTVAQMRELFLLMAARDGDPDLRTRPEEFLSREDIRRLREAGSRMSESEVRDYLDRMSSDDLGAMMRVARQAALDDRVSHFLNLVASVLRVTGTSEEDGLVRDLFNSVYFSMSGEINVSTLFRVAIGRRDLTPLSGVSLENLAKGEGPDSAWAQYFALGVDFRAVVNTIARWTKPDLARKELEKPFPYSPHLGDVAAYEVRVFGLPLLMFYKRGLTRADARAYEEDYAYGLYGPRVVEHFRTREELESEVRAGRMVPLGWVRVRDGRGGWRSTHLAVFAHQMPDRRPHARTAIVVYGLRAFEEGALQMGRALERFRLYERVQAEGGVIEQVVAAAEDAGLKAADFEPVIRPGAGAIADRYAPVLADLTELHRFARRRALGLAASMDDRIEERACRERLEGHGIWLDPGDPRLEVDGFNSSFVFRRRVEGSWRDVKWVLMVSPEALARDREALEQGACVDALRRRVASGELPAVVMLNEAVMGPDGRWEVGPLLRDAGGEVAGTGAIAEPEAVRRFLERLEQLPVMDQARLRFRRYAATLLELDFQGVSHATRVFVTVEFAPGPRRTERVSRWSGEREVTVHDGGVWRGSVTDRRIVELEVDEAGFETSSRTYANLGTRAAPVRGDLIEETRTLEIWVRDLGRWDVDPYASSLVKLRTNHVTGEFVRETYGLFPVPLETDDGRFITRRRFQPDGAFESATVFENLEGAFGSSAWDPTRPGRAGRVRQTWEREGSTGATMAPTRDRIRQTDHLLGVVRTRVFDRGSFGRLLAEEATDPFDGGRKFSRITEWEYRDEVHHGLIPVRFVTRAGPGRAVLEEVTLLSYDAAAKRLTGVHVDDTGKRSTRVWASHWEHPVEIVTALRRTRVHFGEDGTRFEAVTLGRLSGEAISQSETRWDALVRRFVMTSVRWHRPGVAARVETTHLSPGGKLISTRWGEVWEIRPVYDEEGREVGRRGYARDGATAVGERRVWEEGRYRWKDGRRVASVTWYVDDRPYEMFETEMDEEGRVVVDGIRVAGGLRWRTRVAWDRDTERVLRAEEWQDEQLRALREPLVERWERAGVWVLPVRVTPAWGLVETNTYGMGDPLSRLVEGVAENGDRLRVLEWFEGSGLARVVEVRDRHGRVRQRRVREVGGESGAGGGVDRVTVLGGGPGLGWGWRETQTWERGTGRLLFADTADLRLVYDPRKPFSMPLYRCDPRGGSGVFLEVAGGLRSNVVTAFQGRLSEEVVTGGAASAIERVLKVAAVDFRGGLHPLLEEQTWDRAGRCVEVRRARLPAMMGDGIRAEAWFERLGGEGVSLERVEPRYLSGWWVLEPATDELGSVLAFTGRPPLGEVDVWAVNDGNWREELVEQQVWRPGGRGASALAQDFEPVFRLSRPRRIRGHPVYGEGDGCWTTWTGQRLDARARVGLDFDLVRAESGEPSFSVVRKRTRDGRVGFRVGYQLTEPPGSLAPLHRLSGDGRTPWTVPCVAGNADFVAVVFPGHPEPLPHLAIRDGKGVGVIVSVAAAPGAAVVSRWPMEVGGETWWWPDSWRPRYGASLGASPGFLAHHGVLAVSVADLADAGLEVDGPLSLTLFAEGSGRLPDQVCGPLVLRSGVRPPGFSGSGKLRSAQEVRSSGLRVVTRGREGRRQEGWTASVTLDGRELVQLKAGDKPPHAPVAVVLDSTTPDVGRPLYRVWADDGSWLGYHDVSVNGGYSVFTVLGGLEAPLLETHRAEVLDDEQAPGLLTFGVGHPLTVTLARGGSRWEEALANLRNRWAASVFALAAQPWAPVSREHLEARRTFEEFSRLHALAVAQAERIAALPPLAVALVPRRSLPWVERPVRGGATGEGPGVRFLGEWLRRSSLVWTNTGLIATQPGGAMERWVDTVEECRLIQLAVRVQEVAVALEVLEFYHQKTRGGLRAVHTSYDAATGAPLVHAPGRVRPVEAGRSADAQTALAEAALSVAEATRDPRTTAFAQRATDLLFREYRQRDPAEGARGLADERAQPVVYGTVLTYWPVPARYSVHGNVRALQLLRRWEALAPQLGVSDEWRAVVHSVAAELVAWMAEHVLPDLERFGVPPKGMFVVQDVNGGTTALAPERMTTAEDWLALLEVVDELPLSLAEACRALENLARVHGVWVGDVWGLDWNLALVRSDAISPALTARFARVADRLGHEPAAAFARHHLAGMRRDGHWPAVITSGPPMEALVLSAAHSIHPVTVEGAGSPKVWPLAPASHLEWVVPGNTDLIPGEVPVPPGIPEQRDSVVFMGVTAAFYLSLVGVTLFWWALGGWRRRRRRERSGDGSVVSEAVMARAEERWATRVLGAIPAPRADRSRFSNSPTEPGFHMQLRAIYKLVLEYRRRVNGWAENGRELVEDGTDPWLNGLDEFVVMIGLYTRYVVKAGRKDGCRKADLFAMNEDSNHLWSRLVCYFSEFHLELLTLISRFLAERVGDVEGGASEAVETVLRTMGVRPRREPLDARIAFNAPCERSDSFDLRMVQMPGTTLEQVALAMEARLGVPRVHFEAFLRRYQDFKEREDLFPLHPHLLEAAKLLPHFLFMGLAALVWYNVEEGGLPLFPYLKDTALGLLRDPISLVWMVPLGSGWLLGGVAHGLSIYRYRHPVRSRTDHPLWVDSVLKNLLGAVVRPEEPGMRAGVGWNPVPYRRCGWMLRIFGLGWLAVTLWRLPAPSFVLGLLIGLVALVLIAEAVTLGLPLVTRGLVRGLEDRAVAKGGGAPVARWLSRWNVVAARPASMLWTSFKYHFQPSVPTGDVAAIIQSIAFYLVFAASFLGVGGYLSKEALALWFRDIYHLGRDMGLLAGTGLLGCTMYLLRFGLFVLFVAVASSLVTYPVRTMVAVATLGYSLLVLAEHSVAAWCATHPWLLQGVVLVAVMAVLAEPELMRGLARLGSSWAGRRRGTRGAETALEALRSDPERAFGIVYMSGDHLSALHLTPEVLMTRVRLLRDRLDSSGLRLLAALDPWRDDAVLEDRFRALHEAECLAGVTLWHPCQLVEPGRTPVLEPGLGLGIPVAGEAGREALLSAWHLRRWVVTMMATAGHAQDTGINLVDLALRVDRDGLGRNAVFYLIQNKYDDADSNRPSQAAYDRDELGQRNKLARLLMAVAPGCRAYSLNNWTPFGFKAGGLVAMDLVPEESLRLTHLVVLDRNANVHDLDAFMADLRGALADPSVVIVIPGRGTTNTLTPVGQASRAIEEGNRALVKGVILLGGESGESLGTGWGNIQAVHYGRVQRALCDPETPLLPLTTRTGSGAGFVDRAEGLIGFGPHAVGISEDIWGVTQAAHNAVGLGLGARFLRSRAMWHKLRETWSHAEWFQAFPRWSGGYVQMMHDPLMQRVNDAGPQSVFAKEIRANGGRYFLSAPVALFTILIMPLAILTDVSPFVKILILLWNLGLLMNQVLAGLGLLACLESSGFDRIPAVVGALLAAAVGVVFPEVGSWLAPLVVVGALGGGFVRGLGRWLYHRGRDLVLFGPQLVIHVLGQMVRQSLEFVLSGASAHDAHGVNLPFRTWVGPREDRPHERYGSPVNLRTVVWGVGLGSFLLNLFALAQLDFLNVLLLLPTLLFSVSCLLGPFVLQPAVGKALGHWTWVPRTLGWLLGVAFYLVLVAAVMRGGWGKAVAFGLGVTCVGRLLSIGLRYVAYPRRFDHLSRELMRRFLRAGATPEGASRAVGVLMGRPGMEATEVRSVLAGAGVGAVDGELTAYVVGTVQPLLRRPITDLHRATGLGSRFGSEIGRSFVLSLGTLVWFLLVPVPGVLALQAPAGYQVSIPLESLLWVVGGMVAMALIGVGCSTLLDAQHLRTAARGGLVRQAVSAWEVFRRASLDPGGGNLGAQEVSSVYALFTDLQSYLDQRSFAYAWRTLGLIRETLRRVEGR